MFEVWPSALHKPINEKFGPVVAVFTPTELPESRHPKEISSHWRGLHLPVREENMRRMAKADVWRDRVNSRQIAQAEAIPVLGIDALTALRSDVDRCHAHNYWSGSIALTEIVIFKRAEGTLLEVAAAEEPVLLESEAAG